MKIKYSDKFLKSIAGLDQDLILKKLTSFVEQLSKASSNFTSLPKGFWIKRFHSNSNRFKFRVSNKDRIIYELSEDKQTIYFLAYCNHDEQVRAAKRISSSDFLNCEIDKSEYKESASEKLYDENLLKEAYEFLDLGDLVSSKEKFTEAGDFSIAKKINQLINLNNAKNDFKNEENRIQLIIRSEDKVLERDILKFFNRLYSKYQIVPGNYMKLSTGLGCSFDIWLSGVNTNNKLATEYIKDLVESITKKCGKIFCCRLTISCCLYSVKDKTLYTNYKSFILDLDTNTLSPSLNKYAFLEQSDHHYKDLEELKYHNKDKLSKDVLDFIFK